MKKIILLFTIFSYYLLANQYKTIENQAVRVIYQEGLEDEARETANMLENLRKYYLEDGFEGNLKQIPVVLRKGNNISNAYFTAMPNKLDYVTIAPISGVLGVSPWLLDLSIHEYRHFMQYQLIRKNKYSKLVYALNGNQSTMVLGMLTIPGWVWEGDAIHYETKLSDNGRGRTASFLKEYRMIFNESEVFSYEKAKNGSYKDLVPSYYHLGYLLVNYGYEKYGDKFWEGVFKDGVLGNGILPFSSYIKKETGLSSEEFYKEAMEYYKEYFKLEKTVHYKDVLSDIKTISKQSFAYAYDDKIISLLSDYDSGSAFYEISEGKKKKIISLGQMYDNYFELKNDKIIWSEIEPHLTKSSVNFYNIKIYDLKEKIRKNVTKNTYYQSPALSNDTQKIAAINHSGIKDSSIDILDLEGNLLKSLKNDKKYFYNYLRWSQDDNSLIVSLRDSKGKMALIEIDINSEKENTIIDFDDYVIGVPFVDGDNIYFDASFDLIENIYKINKNDKKIYQVTESNIGATYPTIIKNNLYFSEYGKRGNILKVSSLTDGFITKAKSLKNDEKMNTSIIKNSNFNLIEADLSKEYEEKKYNYAKNLINIHSWSYSFFPGNTSLGIISTNEVEDLSLTANYSNDSVNNKKSINLEGEYSGFWPSVNLKISKEETKNTEDSQISLGLNFPFNLSKNEFQRLANLSLSYNAFDNKNEYFNLSAYFANVQYGGVRNIKSPNSQNLLVSYWGNLDKVSQGKFSLDGVFTKETFGKNDFLSYSFSYEKMLGDTRLSEKGIISRGYKQKDYNSALKSSFDYDFPIAYPDFGGKGYYLQRIKGNIFYDNTLIDSENTFQSVGTALDLDSKLLSLLPISFRLQYSYLLDEKRNNFSLGISGQM